MNFAERILETLRWRPVHPRPTFIVYAPPAIGGRENTDRPGRIAGRRRPRPAPPSAPSSPAPLPIAAIGVA